MSQRKDTRAAQRANDDGSERGSGTGSGTPCLGPFVHDSEVERRNSMHAVDSPLLPSSKMIREPPTDGLIKQVYVDAK